MGYAVAPSKARSHEWLHYQKPEEAKRAVALQKYNGRLVRIGYQNHEARKVFAPL